MGVVLAAAFGAADQYLGSRGFALGYWATQASLLSAPWLLVAFLAGWSQPTAKRAAILGLACTFAALGGYWAMTLSPMEGAHITARGIGGLVASQALLVVGGWATGPLFAWLGYRWRTRRDPVSALAVALAVSCEPIAHAIVGTSDSFGGVWAAEIIAGLLMAVYAISGARRISG